MIIKALIILVVHLAYANGDTRILALYSSYDSFINTILAMDFAEAPSRFSIVDKTNTKIDPYSMSFLIYVHLKNVPHTPLRAHEPL